MNSLTLSTLRLRAVVGNFHPAFRHIIYTPQLLSPHDIPFPLSSSIIRSISQSSLRGNYEGDGKTTMTILNHEIDSPLMIDGYHENGFRLNNGFHVRGPMAIFPKSVLSWDVGSTEQITAESLALFSMLEPKLDVLIIGVGDKGTSLPLETIRSLQKKRINFEILPTDHALATFNFLNFERRCVAAALLPPKTITYGTEDLLRNRMDKNALYSPTKHEAS